MRRLTILCTLLWLSIGVGLALGTAPFLLAQTPRMVVPGAATLPATCNVQEVFFKTGTGVGLYACLAPNTWSPFTTTIAPTVTGPMTINGPAGYPASGFISQGPGSAMGDPYLGLTALNTEYAATPLSGMHVGQYPDGYGTIFLGDYLGEIVFTPTGNLDLYAYPDLTIHATLTVTGTIQGAGYKSSDGSTGATVTTCTGFKNGLCISGTP